VAFVVVNERVLVLARPRRSTARSVIVFVEADSNV
jgi:hypothetical protein